MSMQWRARALSVVWAVAAGATAVSCLWRSNPPATICSFLTFQPNRETQFVLAPDSTPQLTYPFTIIIDNVVLGITKSDTDSVSQLSRGIQPGSVKSVEFISATKAKERWPSVTSNVINITRCHEPTRLPIGAR